MHGSCDEWWRQFRSAKFPWSLISRFYYWMCEPWTEVVVSNSNVSSCLWRPLAVNFAFPPLCVNRNPKYLLNPPRCNVDLHENAVQNAYLRCRRISANAKILLNIKGSSFIFVRKWIRGGRIDWWHQFRSRLWGLHSGRSLKYMQIIC